jgi:hypothetical protein
MTAGQIRQARDLLTLPGNSISSIARLPVTTHRDTQRVRCREYADDQQ